MRASERLETWLSGRYIPSSDCQTVRIRYRLKSALRLLGCQPACFGRGQISRLSGLRTTRRSGGLPRAARWLSGQIVCPGSRCPGGGGIDTHNRRFFATICGLACCYCCIYWPSVKQTAARVANAMSRGDCLPRQWRVQNRTGRGARADFSTDASNMTRIPRPRTTYVAF